MSHGKLHQLMRSVLQYARLRAEIVELELDLERSRLGALALRSLVMALAALLGIQLVIVLLLALAWDTPWRLHAIVALIAAALLVVYLTWRSLGRVRVTPGRLLSAALADIDELSDTTTPEMPPLAPTPEPLRERTTSQ